MGRKIYNPQTGEWREWTGTEWAPVEGPNPTQIEAARMAARTTAEQPGGSLAAGLIQFGESFGTPLLSRVLGGRESGNEAEARRMALREEFPRATMAGDVAALGAQIAMPAGSVLRGGRLATLPVATNVGAQAGLGALANPDDPGMGAMLGGGAGAVGAGVARVLSGAMRMPERVMAQRALREAAAGVQPADAAIGATMQRVAPARNFDEMATVAGEADDQLRAGAAVFRDNPQTMGGATGAMGEPSPAHTEFVARAQKLGYELLPGEEFNSRPLRMIEDAAKNNPAIAATVVQPTIDRNARRLNRYIGDYINEVAPGVARGADEITPRTLGQMRNKLQTVFEQGYKQAGDLDADALRMRVQTIAEHPDTFGLPVDKVAQNLFRFEKDGTIRAGAVQEVRNRWAKEQADAYKRGEHVTGDMYESLVNMLDGAVAKSAGPEIGEAMNRARQGWRFLLALEKPGVVAENGMVNGEALYRQMRRGYKLAWEGVERPGKSTPALQNVVDSLRVANFFTDTFGKSPTAHRLMSRDLLTPVGFAQAAAGPLVSRAYVKGMRSDAGRALVDRFSARQAAGIMASPVDDVMP